MKELHTSLLGFHSTIGCHHLESKLRTGSYVENGEVRKYGMEECSNGNNIVLYRTNKGIAIDLKQYNQHIIFSTINNGDVLSDETWDFIKDTVLEELEISNTKAHTHQDAIKAHAAPYAQQFVSHLHKLETEFDSDYTPQFGSTQTH